MRSMVGALSFALAMSGCVTDQQFKQELALPATPLQEALSMAYLDFEVIDWCGQNDESAQGGQAFTPNALWEQTAQKGWKDYYQAYEKIEGLVGEEADVTDLIATSTYSRKPDCTDRFVNDTAAHANALLAKAAKYLRPIEMATDKGLWVGQFPLCIETIGAASQDTSLYGEPALSLTLKPELAERFRVYTSQFVDRILLVRLNGVTTSKPRVFSALGSSLSVSMPAEKISEAMQAVNAECSGPLPAQH